MMSMNVPEMTECLEVEGEEKIKEVKLEKIPNAAQYIISKEDHTLGNIVQNQLLRNKKVLFAGYRVPHPLEHNLEIKIQTNDPSYTPRRAFSECIENTKEQLKHLKKNFEEQISKVKKQIGEDDIYRDEMEIEEEYSRVWET